MLQLVLRGRVAPNVLATLSNLTRSFQDNTSVVYAFVLRQEQDIPVGTTFCVIGTSATRQGVTEHYRLVAVSQQYDRLMDEIPHGWNTVCAFQRLDPGPGLLVGLPLVGDWYEQRAIELVLTVEDEIMATQIPQLPDDHTS